MSADYCCVQTVLSLGSCRTYLFQALALKIFALNLVVQVVDICPVMLSPVNLKCVLRTNEH